MVARYLANGDLAPAAWWRLVEWCVARGADEFTVDVMALRDTPAPLADAFEDALGARERTPEVRMMLDGGGGPSFPGVVRLWALDEASLEQLRRFLPDGPLSYGAQGIGAAGWLENLIVYREGELMLGVVTHEQEGVVRVTPAERAELEALGIPLRAAGQAIRYAGGIDDDEGERA